MNRLTIVILGLLITLFGAWPSVALTITDTDDSIVEIYPESVDFGLVSLGLSTNIDIYIANRAPLDSDRSITIIEGYVTGDFSVSFGDCMEIAPGQSCVITLGFEPSDFGELVGTLTLVTNGDVAGEHVVPLRGTSVGGDPFVLDLSRSSLDFGSVVIGSTASQSFFISNLGISDESLSINVRSDQFSQESDCPTALVPGESCEVIVSYTPTRPGTQYDLVEIYIEDSDEPYVSVLLTGTGNGEPNILVEPAIVDFKQGSVGEIYSDTMTISNSGTDDLIISSVAVSDYHFLVNSDCSLVPPDSFCAVEVTYVADGFTTTGSINIESNDPDQSPLLVPIVIETVADFPPVPSLSTDAVIFDKIKVGSQSELMLTLTNEAAGGDEALIVNAVTSSDLAFSQTNDCSSLAPGESCTTKLTFSPVTICQHSGTLRFSTNAGDLAVDLLGYGYGNFPGLGQLSVDSECADWGLQQWFSFLLARFFQ